MATEREGREAGGGSSFFLDGGAGLAFGNSFSLDFCRAASAAMDLSKDLPEVFADFVEMEKVVRASGLDWTIVRPPRLTDKPFSGNYRTRRDVNMHRNFAVSRADVAHLILAACADRESYDAAIYIAS